ncbi:MAG: response regulator [Spirochaetaceae bacterium]|nr:response regulator [Spirochaetaceae bacterium]
MQNGAFFEIYSVFVLMAAIIAVALAAFAWFGAKKEYARPFAFLEFGVFLWCIFSYLQLRVSDPSQQLLNMRLSYTGILIVPVAGFAFGRALSRQPLAPRSLAAFSILPCVTLVFVWTSDWLPLLWGESRIVDGILSPRPGPWFWVHSAYSYALIVASIHSIGRRSRETWGSVRRWLRHTMSLLILPAAVNVLYVAVLMPIMPFDPTPPAFAVSGLFLGFGLRRYNLFDAVPYAKEAIIEAMQQPVITTDGEGRVVGGNEAANALFGGPGSIEGALLAAFCPAAARAAASPDSRAEPWRKGPRHYLITAYAIKSRHKPWAGSLLVFSDVTEQALANRALAESEEAFRRYAFMVNASRDFMSIVNRSYRYEAVNDAFCASYGRCRDDIVGSTVSDVWGEEIARENILPALDACFRGEYVVIRKRFTFAGERGDRDLEVSYNPYHAPSGEVSHAVVITKDVGDYIRTQRELAEARERADEANEAKSAFLAAMSHELRTPLNAVIGLTELCLRDPLSAAQRDNLETVRTAGKSLLNIINDILDLSKIEAGRMTLERSDFDLVDHLSRILKAFGPALRDKGLSFELVVEPDCPRFVRGDSLRLGQILLNLVGNAVKFTERGGILVTLAAERAPSGELPGMTVGLLVSVRDSGVGIPKEKQELIFESFSQADSSVSRRYGGTGLGLSICKNLVALFGGRIWVESTPGAGSVFSFTARFEPGDAARVAERAAGEAERLGPVAPDEALDILVVEDNALNAKVVLRWLEQAGHRASHAPTGAEAILFLARKPFDLVLMDVEMPDIDGLEAARRIRGGAAGAERRGVPIIAMTAHAGPAIREEAARAGMDDYVGKPIDFAELSGALSRVYRPASRGLAAVPETAGKAGGEAAAAARPALIDASGPMKRLGGDEELYLELLDIFAAEAPARKLAFAGTMEARGRDAPDREALRRLAHSLRGGALTIGAQPLAAAAAALEAELSGAGGAAPPETGAMAARVEALLELLAATAGAALGARPQGHGAEREE